MSRFLARILAWIAALVLAWPVVVQAQDQGFGALARVGPQGVQLRGTRADVTLDMALTQGVPWRAWMLDNPPRLIMDFREVDWRGLDSSGADAVRGVTELRYGAFRPGWSRMVLELDSPMVIGAAGMRVSPESGAAALSVRLDMASAEAMAAQTGVAADPAWDLPVPVDVPADAASKLAGSDRLVIVLDPGHGGIDPGAERDGVSEKDLMLRFARELKDILTRGGLFDVILTREDDTFVSLERRIAIAHAAGADLFISLHADALAEGRAHGAVVHLLADEATDAASAQLAERHDRDELLAGVDLTGQDDQVAGILMDLARQETQPRAERLSVALIDGLLASEVEVNSRPIRRAAFSVLKAADIPSVLLELGFMSSPRDLANLRDPRWRVRFAGALRDGIRAWAAEDVVLRGLVRQ
ncbi:MAG: N-acetylmuramoyl-L-alanine amidase [Paracoccaceae bacterium]